MGCNLSSQHKLQGFQTIRWVWVVGYLLLPQTAFPYSLCWLRAETDLASGESIACPVRCSHCVLWHLRVTGMKPESSPETLLGEGRAAWKREERGQSPGHALSDAWQSGKHSGAD